MTTGHQTARAGIGTIGRNDIFSTERLFERSLVDLRRLDSQNMPTFRLKVQSKVLVDGILPDRRLRQKFDFKPGRICNRKCQSKQFDKQGIVTKIRSQVRSKFWSRLQSNLFDLIGVCDKNLTSNQVEILVGFPSRSCLTRELQWVKNSTSILSKIGNNVLFSEDKKGQHGLMK